MTDQTPDWRALVAEFKATVAVRPIGSGGCVMDLCGKRSYIDDSRDESIGRYITGVGARTNDPREAVRAALEHLRHEVDRRITELQAARNRLGPMAHNRGESRATRSEA